MSRSTLKLGPRGFRKASEIQRVDQATVLVVHEPTFTHTHTHTRTQHTHTHTHAQDPRFLREILTDSESTVVGTRGADVRVSDTASYEYGKPQSHLPSGHPSEPLHTKTHWVRSALRSEPVSPWASACPDGTPTMHEGLVQQGLTRASGPLKYVP